MPAGRTAASSGDCHGRQGNARQYPPRRCQRFRHRPRPAAGDARHGDWAGTLAALLGVVQEKILQTLRKKRRILALEMQVYFVRITMSRWPASLDSFDLAIL